MATWEEASHCPKCDMPGHQVSSQPLPRRAKAIVLTCMNDRCRWYNTSWIVQVNADGSIPERRKGPKEFPAITPGQEAYARRSLEDIVAEDPALRRAYQRLLEGK